MQIQQMTWTRQQRKSNSTERLTQQEERPYRKTKTIERQTVQERDYGKTDIHGENTNDGKTDTTEVVHFAKTDTKRRLALRERLTFWKDWYITGILILQEDWRNMKTDTSERLSHLEYWHYVKTDNYGRLTLWEDWHFRIKAVTTGILTLCECWHYNVKTNTPGRLKLGKDWHNMKLTLHHSMKTDTIWENPDTSGTSWHFRNQLTFQAPVDISRRLTLKVSWTIDTTTNMNKWANL